MEYIKNRMGTLLLIVASFVVGISLGVNTQENENGVYFSLNYPDGENMFLLGKNGSSLKDLDFNLLEADVSNMLISKIEVTSPDSDFGRKVRETATDGEGPFTAIPISLDVHLVSGDSRVQGPIARACVNSQVLGNALIAHQWQDAGTTKRIMMDIHPLIKEPTCSDDATPGQYSLWINRDYAKDKLGFGDSQGDKISINANMVVSVLSI